MNDSKKQKVIYIALLVANALFIVYFVWLQLKYNAYGTH